MAAPKLRLRARVRRVGNSIALIIPAKAAREAGLRAGDQVEASIQVRGPDPLGLLKDLPYEPFERRKEGLWRDRI